MEMQEEHLSPGVSREIKYYKKSSQKEASPLSDISNHVPGLLMRERIQDFIPANVTIASRLRLIDPKSENVLVRNESSKL